MLLNAVVRDMCKQAGVPIADLPGVAFRAGIPEADIVPESIAPVLEQRGYAFIGFRDLSRLIPRPVLARTKKVVLVRDPRDMIVSLYFSMKHSHFVPPQGEMRQRLLDERREASETTPDSYAQTEAVRNVMNAYRTFLDVPGDVRFYRYEDIIFKKREWLVDMAAYLDLDVPADRLHAIADKHDIVPDEEKPEAHVRQVRPGNFRVHLSPETVSRLNLELSDLLTRFGYEKPDEATLRGKRESIA